MPGARYRVGLAALLVLAAPALQAEGREVGDSVPTEVVVEGIVVDRRGRPVPSATISDPDGPAGSSVLTDDGGRFSITVRGDRLRIVAPGFAPREVPIGDGQTIRLRRTGRRAETVVRDQAPWGEDPSEELQAAPGGRRVRTARSLERVPGSLGDPLRALQSDPAASGDPGGRALLRLRSAAPDELTIELDGIRLRRLEHLAGLVSALHPDALRDFTLELGAARADRPDSLGGAVLIRAVDGPEAGRVDGSASLDLLGVGAALRARLDPAGRHRLVVAARQSFVAPYLAAARAADPLELGSVTGDYGEVLLRYGVQPTHRSEVRFTGLWTRDRFVFDDVDERGTTIGGAVDARIDSLRGHRFTAQMAHATTIDDDPARPEDPTAARAWRDGEHRTHLRLGWRKAARDFEVAAGMEGAVTVWTLRGTYLVQDAPRWAWLPLAERAGRDAERDLSVVDPTVALWGEATVRNPDPRAPLEATVGLRAVLWSPAGRPRLAPRLALQLPLPSGTTLGGSVALVSQERRDPEVLVALAAGHRVRAEQALRAELGVRQALGSYFVLGATGWLRAELALLEPPTRDPGFLLGSRQPNGQGLAGGVELLASWRHGRGEAQLGYSLGGARRTWQGARVASHGDPRHAGRLSGAVRFGRQDNLSFGVQYLLRSGFAVGSLDATPYGDGWRWSVRELDDRRRPTLHRISARFEHRIPLGPLRLQGMAEIAVIPGDGTSVEDCPPAGEPACRSLTYLPPVMPWVGLRAAW